MSICSRHQTPEPGCKLCQLDARDVLPDFDEKLAEAEAAGTHECRHCGFEFYLTTPTCPLCETVAPGPAREGGEA